MNTLNTIKILTKNYWHILIRTIYLFNNQNPLWASPTNVPKKKTPKATQHAEITPKVHKKKISKVTKHI